jgi:putative ABC transport system ATP-binding protein
MQELRPLIKTLRLTKDYKVGRSIVTALRGVSIKIPETKFSILYGPSGSGKTTLLNIIGLIDLPTEGEVFLEKIDIASLGRLKRSEMRLNNIGFVFQKYYLLEELTALENVYLPAVAKGGFSRTAVERARHLLELVGLKERLRHKPEQLSEGEKQRVAVARSLINEPKILLCDEPTASLDADNRKIVLDLLVKINKEKNVTVFLVTHDEAQLGYADKVFYIRDGLIIKETEKNG